MKFDVVGFGALNVDKIYRVPKIAREEEETFVFDFQETPGGSAANTIVGLARLGLKTGFIGKLADDHEGHLLLNDFKREGVNTDGIVVAKEGRSGVVAAYVDKKGERALYVHPSVNDSLTFEEINLEYAKQARFLHLTSVDEKPFQAQKKLVKELPSNVKVSLDPGDIYAKKGLTGLRTIIKRSFVIFPNESELKMLTGKGWKEGAKTLLKEGVSIVAVKLGEQGCYVTDGKEAHLIEPFRVNVVDTIGAGDAFCAGFLYGLVKRRDLYQCGRLGNFVASRCITKVGARTGLPQLHDLKNVLNKVE
jgi:ribokinase